MIDKKSVPTKLLWVDLEMTGLDPQNDIILEIAAEITDFEFNKLASYEACVKQPQQQVIERMDANPWWADYPENRDEFVKRCQDGKPPEQVEQEMCDLIKQYFGDEPAVLAGNSIHNDRNFIKQWWPRLDACLHYRMLDVSAWKVFMQGRNGVEYDKQNLHRAYDDIQASIAELKYYLDWFKQN